MQIVIDIPNGAYKEITTANFPIQDGYRLVAWIKNGTPLPKGHGRLIDADALKKKVWDVDCRVGYVQVVDAGDIDDAETIVEAGKEGNDA